MGFPRAQRLRSYLPWPEVVPAFEAVKMKVTGMLNSAKGDQPPPTPRPPPQPTPHCRHAELVTQTRPALSGPWSVHVLCPLP